MLARARWDGRSGRGSTLHAAAGRQGAPTHADMDQPLTGRLERGRGLGVGALTAKRLTLNADGLWARG